MAWSGSCLCATQHGVVRGGKVLYTVRGVAGCARRVTWLSDMAQHETPWEAIDLINQYPTGSNITIIMRQSGFNSRHVSVHLQDGNVKVE